MALLESLQLSCTFNNGSLCDWTQEQFKDEVDYVNIVGSTLCQTYYGNTGPINDALNSSNHIFH